MTRTSDAAKPVRRLQFVTVLNSGKADPGARRVIRSQARRTRKQKRKSGPAFGFDGLHGPQEDDQPVEQAILVYTPQIPSRVGGDLDFVSVAADIEASILLNIIKVTPTAVKLIFPLSTAMGFPADEEQRMYPIARDAASLHITAFAIEGFIDRVLRRLPASSSRALLHLGKGLALLRNRLSGADGDTAAAVSDATIGAVMKLASVAHFDGDYDVARQHMRGVKRMVDVRGGLDALTGQPGLAEEILRYDIAVALLDGEMPLFHTSPTESLPVCPESLLMHTTEEIPPPVLLNHSELAKCWRVIRRFSLLVDLGSRRDVRCDQASSTRR